MTRPDDVPEDVFEAAKLHVGSGNFWGEHTVTVMVARAIMAERERNQQTAADLRIALADLLRAEYEAAGFGLTDCVDNSGKPYQSAYLDRAIKRAEALLSATAIRKGS